MADIKLLMREDGANGTVVDEKINNGRAGWEVVEVEEKSSSVAIAVQMEMAETLETL
nr:kinesin-like protein KIN-4A [Ipomoea trifida]